MAIVDTPLIIEPHPETYVGYPFITLIQFRTDVFMTIVDNYDGKIIKAYVLDTCGPEGIDEETTVNIANEWYNTNRSRYPISFEFSKRGVSGSLSKIYRTFNVEYVVRVIGPVPRFPMDSVVKIQRRKRRSIPPGVNVIHRRIKMSV